MILQAALLAALQVAFDTVPYHTVTVSTVLRPDRSMPELPEVEIMTRHAERWLAGRTVSAFQIHDPRVVTEGGDIVDQLAGQTITGARRRAKHLILQTDGAEVAVHFRMTGKLLLGPAKGRIRWSLLCEDGTQVDFADSRCLGDTRFFALGGADRWLAGLKLGPEPYPGVQPAEWWQARLLGARGAIKTVLMDQARVAGIGNILASEILWRAGIAPQRPATSLSADELSGLATAVPAFIDDVIREESGDEIAYVGETRDAGEHFAVYAREGAPCRRCAGVVARFKQASRSTFWCPACQA